LFLKLLLEHQSKIYAYILSLVPNYADADDILQNVSEIIWRRFDQFQPGTNFLAWALKCTHLEILYFRRKQSKSRQVVFDNEVLEQMLPIVADEITTIDDRRDALENCLKRLPDVSRETIRLRYYQGLRPKEISVRLGFTIANVYKVISRIHRKLLLCVEQTLATRGCSNE